MWLMTKFGFFSVVQKNGETNLTIRARVRSDLEEFQTRYLPALGDIREKAGTDYQYRASASHADLANAMQRIILDIDYSNFKNTVAKEQGTDRAHVYGKVWNDLWKLADG